MFNAPKLTDAGKSLYYDNMAGTKIKFTTIQLGSGNISGPIAAITALVNPVVTIDAEVKNVADKYDEISGHFSNAQLADGFYFRESASSRQTPIHPVTAAEIFCTVTKMPTILRTLSPWLRWKR